jgi:probable HAF family extracellular repeat protein
MYGRLVSLFLGSVPIISMLAVGTTAQTPAGTQLHYRLIDLGTLGGPNSSETLEFPFVNNAGMVVGFSDTSTPDPFNPGGFLPHAFRWQKGVLTDLGTLPGGKLSFAIWSNNLGQVVGLSDNGRIDPDIGGPEAFATLWDKNGQAFNLGTLGGTQSLAAFINSQGQVAGVAANTIPDSNSFFGWATQTRAFLWEKGVMRDLGTLGGTDASASWLNDLGQVAGTSYVDSNPSCPFDFPVTTHAFFWWNGKMVDIGTLGGSCSGAVVMNNRGQVAGNSTLPGDNTDHPFLWSNAKIQDLGTIGGTFGLVSSMNEAGNVTGGATTAGDEEFHAFFWSHAVMTDLGTIGDDTCSVVHFMNARSQVVGTSGDCFGQFEIHGFLWQPGGGMIDLNDFVPPGSDLVITDGETINDDGEIAASGMLPNGAFHAVLLVPCGDSSDPGCRGASQTNVATSAASTPKSLQAQGVLRPQLLKSLLARHGWSHRGSSLRRVPLS